MNTEDRRNRLVAWLEVIKEDVQDLMYDHYVFWEVQDILRANPKASSASGLFNQWMASSFIQSAAVGVRRQAKANDDSVSLKRFLKEVRQFPELVSRDVYLAFFAASPAWLTESNGIGYFDSLAGPGGPHIQTSVVDQQMAELDAAVNSVEHYVDRRIAHYDKRGLAKPVPTFKDLEGALKALESGMSH